MFDKAATPIANEATSPAPEPAVQQKRPRGRPRSNPNDPKWLNAPTPVARPATAKRGIPKDDDDAFQPTEYFKKRAEERVPTQPRKSKRARTLVYESLDQEVIMAKDPEPIDNARGQVTQEPTPPPSGNPSEAPTSGESSPRDSIVVPAENPSGHHHHQNDNNKSNNERFGRGPRPFGLPTPPDSSPDNDNNKNGRMGPPPPRRSGLLSPSPDSPPNPARVPGSVLARPAHVPARAPGSVLARPAPVPEAAPVPARIHAPAPVRAPAPAPARAPAVPAPPAPLVVPPPLVAPAAPAAPALAPVQVPAVPALDGLDHLLNPLDPLGVGVGGPGPADFPFDVDAAMALYLNPFHLPPAYVNQWDAGRAPGPYNAWVQPERNFFREAIAAHPRGGMCAACMARYGNGFDVLEELFPAFGQQPCCWACPACPGNQYMGAQ